MADIPLVIVKDERKERLRELKAKPASTPLTPAEIKEMLTLIMDILNIK